jgi:NADPH:quinone reductase-like Zn-dependent oxidoreductase
VQVAKQLGAEHVIGAGRDAQRLATLPRLGADTVVQIENGSAVADVARDVDVVIDYLWGPITAEVMAGIATHRSDRSKPLTWIEIGSVAGPSAEIFSAALRAVRLQIVGSGQGSVPTRDILTELPAIAAEITRGSFELDTRAVPLTDVEAAWNDTDADQRIVITP